MDILRIVIRIVLQIALSLLVYVCWLSCAQAMHGIFAEVFSNPNEFHMPSLADLSSEAVVVAGFIGVPALACSILIPAKIIRYRRWIFWPVLTGLVIGSLLAISTLAVAMIYHKGVGGPLDALELLWLYAGPLIVAVWNFIRILRAKQPPQNSVPSVAS